METLFNRDENQELPEDPDELDDEVRDKLSDLEDNPADFEPIYKAREYLNKVQKHLPPEIAGRGEAGENQRLRDRLHEWRTVLPVFESEAEADLRPKSKAERRTRRIAEALDDRDEGAPLYGFEGKTDFLKWAGRQIGLSESTVRNVLGEDGTACLVKGRQGRKHEQPLRRTLENVREYAPESR